MPLTVGWHFFPMYIQTMPLVANLVGVLREMLVQALSDHVTYFTPKPSICAAHLAHIFVG